MTCADTSCWIAYFAGQKGRDVDLLDSALRDKSIVLSPVVLAELLSSPDRGHAQEDYLKAVPLIELTEGFWARAGKTCASLAKHKYRAKLADALIAQSCIDGKVALLTRYRNFQPFARHAGLALIFPFNSR